MLEDDILNVLNNFYEITPLIDLLNSDISKYRKVYVFEKLKSLERKSNGLFRILDTGVKKTVFQIQITRGY